MLPRSKIVPVAGLDDKFGPAPLDTVSLWNGVYKFTCHGQCGFDAEFVTYALEYLNFAFPLAKAHTRKLSMEETTEIYLSPEHADKAAGYPWKRVGATTKEQAFQLDPTLQCGFSVLNSTLKDELRPLGKDARFFRPQSAHDYYYALQLFQSTNDYLSEQLFVSPLFFKFITPGRDITKMFQSLEEFGGDMYDADGARWDANFPLGVAELICTWRVSLMPSESEAITEYYRRMYNGVTLVGGHCFPLVGNPSGHCNTTTDNSLCQMLMMGYSCFRAGIPYWQIPELVRYYVCGDDLIYSDRTHKLFPEFLSSCYNELGCYLEFGSLSPKKLYDLTFVGCTPYYDKIYGLQYHGKLDKLTSAVGFRKKSTTAVDRLSKLVSLAVLVRFSDRWEVLKKVVDNYVVECVKGGYLNVVGKEVSGMLRLMSDEASARLYSEYESQSC